VERHEQRAKQDAEQVLLLVERDQHHDGHCQHRENFETSEHVEAFAVDCEHLREPTHHPPD